MCMCRYFASVEPSALSAGASASPMGRAGAGANEVGTALLRTLRYSSGSLVLGALLVAPLQPDALEAATVCISGCTREQARCW